MSILIAILITIQSLAGGGVVSGPVPPPARLHCLIVGGGPDREDNEVAIESNVRYVRSLLPKSAQTRVLFADGKQGSKTVQYLDANGNTLYRASTLGQIDGPSSYDAYHDNLSLLQKSPSDPLLLYFTGHGSPNREDH